MSNRCKDCCHFSSYFVIGEKQCVRCDLTNTILVDKAAENCGLYNVNLDGQPICFNCKHFGGGCDWGLACRKHYHALPKALDHMCADGEFLAMH